MDRQTNENKFGKSVRDTEAREQQTCNIKQKSGDREARSSPMNSQRNAYKDERVKQSKVVQNER